MEKSLRECVQDEEDESSMKSALKRMSSSLYELSKSCGELWKELNEETSPAMRFLRGEEEIFYESEVKKSFDVYQGEGFSIRGQIGNGVSIYGRGDDTKEAMINGGMTYGGTAMTLLTGAASALGFGTQGSIGNVIMQPKFLLPVTVGFTLLGAARQSGAGKEGGFQDYVNDQFENTVENFSERLNWGSNAAQNKETGYWRELMGRNDRELTITQGDAYNRTIKGSESAFVKAYNDSLRRKMEILSIGGGIYEGILDGKKLDMAIDIQKKVMGEGGDGSITYDKETRDMISYLASLVETYSPVIEKYELDPKSVSEEDLLEASSQLRFVESQIGTVIQNAYTKSDVGKKETETYNRMIDGIQGASRNSFYDAGYSLGENLNEGLDEALIQCESSMLEKADEISRRIHGVGYNTLTGSDPGMDAVEYELRKGKFDLYEPDYGKNPKAFGMNFVPYDGYAATLHWGERVLTASENRQYSQNLAPNINISGTFYIREEADVDKVAMEIARKISLYHEIG